MPDLNSLSPSGSPSLRSIPHTAHPSQPRDTYRPPTPTSSSPLLRSTPHLDRRPSSNLAAFNLDSFPPSPHASHHRAPSLGELHQELENEQEAQVNRMLGQIRQQQVEIQRLQQGTQAQQSSQSRSQHHSRTPSQTLSLPINVQTAELPLSNIPYAGANTVLPRSTSSSVSRQSSAASMRRQSRRSNSGYGEGGMSPSMLERDDAERFSAEAAMVQRENQMLKVRIRELEQLVRGQQETGSAATTASARM